MSTLDEFESTLKEVVEAKRLSASKMTRLTEIAKKSFEHDAKLVAILYRTHKSLPESSKVSSLYVFDALARAAKSHATKHGITGDFTTQPGNAATFLLKLEGVLDGLFQDMVSRNGTETKEKSKKVLDIWVKSNTFPDAVLARLMGIVTGSRKESAVSETTSTPPIPKSPHSPTTAPTPPQPAASSAPSNNFVQNTLLTLLSQAAQGTASFSAPLSQNPDVASLGAPQLALLQQLALTAQLGNAAPSHLPTSQPTGQPPASNGATPGHSAQNSRPTQSASEASRRDPRVSRFMDRDTKQVDDTPSHQNSHRGGYRGRGRGRWDDHHSYGERNGRSPLRRDRSRSPQRSSATRDPRSYHSPHRLSSIRSPVEDRPRESGKDEFGRDLRQSSSTPTNSPTPDITPRQPAAMNASQMDTAPSTARDNHRPAVSEHVPSVTANTSARPIETRTTSLAPAPASASASLPSSEPGLDKFDITTFDFTLPSSWEALGKMWQVTCGYSPGQEELLQFVMTSGANLASDIPAAEATASTNEYTGAQWNEGGGKGGGAAWRGGRGRGGLARGGGGYGHGNYRGNGHTDFTNARTHSNFQDHSDAVVLGGDGVQPSGGGYQGDGNSDNSMQGDESGTGGGRMQRVGDRWMFVKGPPAVQGV